MTMRRDVEAVSGPTSDEIAGAISVLLRAATRPTGGNAATAPEPLMTPEEAAAFARVSPDTIERWRIGGLRCYGRGRVRRYLASDILEFLAREARNEGQDEGAESRARRAAKEIRGKRNGDDL